MGTSISSWENVTAYFSFADSPMMLALFALGCAAIVTGLIVSIKKHEDDAFDELKD
jgi:hypothetical protein